MPNAPSFDHIKFGLIDQTVLDCLQIANRFLSAFMLQARRPRFSIIAPGLLIPDSSTFSKQPFTRVSDGKHPPIVLFRAKELYIPSLPKHESAPRNREFAACHDSPFHHPWYKRFPVYPAGLYMLPTDSTSSEDECRLVLPYAIGANGYARTSNGRRWERKLHKALYELGYLPFEMNHDSRLVDVLKSWVGMVERGDWKIDEECVAGGIDVWKKSDTEERWEGYVIRPVIW
jgi:hypothetical protein